MRNRFQRHIEQSVITDVFGNVKLFRLSGSFYTWKFPVGPIILILVLISTVIIANQSSAKDSRIIRKHVLDNASFFSELWQDKLILEKYFQRGNYSIFNGIFLEIGALDGQNASNTLFFEQELNWNGILIEANPHNFKKLKINRNGNNVFVGKAICEPGQSQSAFQISANVGGIGSLVDNMTQWQRSDKNIWNGKRNKSKIVVECTTSGEIIKQSGIERIDFMSVDMVTSSYKSILI